MYFTNCFSRCALELPVNSDSRLIESAVVVAFDRRCQHYEAMSFEPDSPRIVALDNNIQQIFSVTLHRIDSKFVFLAENDKPSM